MECNRNNIVSLLFKFLWMAFGVVLLGIFHEVGHGLLHRIFGGEIHHIQPFFFRGAPYIRYGYTPYGDLSKAVVSGGGLLFPTIIAVWGLFAIPFERLKVSGVKLLSLIFFFFFSQFLAWIILPVMYYFSIGNFNDDVFEFLVYSGWHPMLVSVLAMVLLGLCLGLLQKRTNIIGLRKDSNSSEDGGKDAWFLKEDYHKEESGESDANSTWNVAKIINLWAWGVVVLGTIVFTIGHLSGDDSYFMSMGRGSFQEYSIGHIEYENHREDEYLSLVYDIDLKAGSFPFYVKGPGGSIVWEKEVVSEELPAEGEVKLPLEKEGKWEIRFGKGVVEGLEVDVRWMIVDSPRVIQGNEP